jgi:hypothetical protein
VADSHICSSDFVRIEVLWADIFLHAPQEPSQFSHCLAVKGGGRFWCGKHDG